jgi:hypothetical protein
VFSAVVRRASRSIGLPPSLVQVEIVPREAQDGEAEVRAKGDLGDDVDAVRDDLADDGGCGS